MAFISIPVLYYPDDYNPEQYEDLKVKPKIKMREGTMWINTHTICQFHETDKGQTIFSLADGTMMDSPLSCDEFRELIEKVEATVDVLLSGNN